MSVVDIRVRRSDVSAGDKSVICDQDGHVARHRTKNVAPASTGSNAARKTVERAVQCLDGKSSLH